MALWSLRHLLKIRGPGRQWLVDFRSCCPLSPSNRWGRWLSLGASLVISSGRRTWGISSCHDSVQWWLFLTHAHRERTPPNSPDWAVLWWGSAGSQEDSRFCQVRRRVADWWGALLASVSTGASHCLLLPLLHTASRSSVTSCVLLELCSHLRLRSS